MRLDIVACEFLEMGRGHEPDFSRFFQRRLLREAVAEDAPDHPERADADRGRAVDEHRPIRRIVGDLQKLVDLFRNGMLVLDGNIEVLQAGLLNGVLLLGRAMLTRRPQVEDGANAFRFQLCEVLEPRLTTGAELGRHPHEAADGRHIGRRWRRLRLRSQEREREEQQHAGHSATVGERWQPARP